MANNRIADLSSDSLPEAARQRLAAVSNFVENIPCIVWSTDTDLRITACIGSGMKSINRTPADLVGKKLDAVLNRDNHHHFAALEAHRRALLRESCSYDVEYEQRFQHAYVEALVGSDGALIGTIGIAFDETEGKRARDCLNTLYKITHIIAEAKNAEEAVTNVLRTVCESLGWQWGAFWVVQESLKLRCLQFWHDPNIDFSEFANVTRSLTATPENSLPGQVVKAERPLWITDLANFRTTRSPIAEKTGFHAAVVFPVRRGSVVVGAMEFLMTEIRDPDEIMLGLMASIGWQVGDLMERLRSQEVLTASEARFRRLVEYSPDAMFINRDDRIVFVNMPCLKLFGADSPDQVLGRSPLDFIHQDYHALVRERIHQIVETSSPMPLVEEKIVRLDGRIVDVEISACPFVEQGKKAIQVVCRDISDRKKLEAQLLQAQKMEAVGQLAGGVAHDFNNLLTVIGGYSELLLGNPRLDDSFKKLLEEIRTAGDRAASLTRQLLAFSRQQVLEPRVLDLNQVALDSSNMLRRLIGEDIDLVTKLDPTLDHVKVDPGQMDQVILNLAVNARDAMPQGGKLTIETANVELDQEYAKLRLDVRPGRYVMLAVSDNGCGMTDDVKQRIFEPFFTTKCVGRGTGLGLATVFGIIKQSEGHVAVYSEVGIGTTFRVYLPRVEERSPGRKSFQLSPVARGSETLLLVEDDDAVRAIARHALRSIGYTVIEARRGDEALRLMEQHRESIQLIISDVVMPEMSGRELAEHLARLAPEVPILYLSGYTDDAIVRHGILQDKVAFLQKPFTIAALSTKVRKVIDAASNAKNGA